MVTADCILSLCDDLLMNHPFDLLKVAAKKHLSLSTINTSVKSSGEKVILVSIVDKDSYESAEQLGYNKKKLDDALLSIQLAALAASSSKVGTCDQVLSAEQECVKVLAKIKQHTSESLRRL